MIPNLPCFSGEFVRNGWFREWLHLCRVETQCSALFFSSKSYLPKHVEIFSSGTYLKVGIIEQSYDFFFLRTLLSESVRQFNLMCSTGSMALRKKKAYSRFSVRAMMKARKTAREQIAAAHESVAALTKNMESLLAKRRRLEAKVISLFLIKRYLCVQLDPKVILWK